MRREIWVCDRCQASAETKEEINELGLGDVVLGFERVGHYGIFPSSVYAPNQKWRKSWCRKCRTELGILEEKIKQCTPPEEVPSIESVIREIVREELSAGQ